MISLDYFFLVNYDRFDYSVKHKERSSLNRLNI